MSDTGSSTNQGNQSGWSTSNTGGSAVGAVAGGAGLALVALLVDRKFKRCTARQSDCTVVLVNFLFGRSKHGQWAAPVTRCRSTR